MSIPSKALLLAAGLGTRLQPLTSVRAKPALPVAGEPIARRIVAWLSRYGVTDLVVNLHHLPATLTAVLGDGSDLGTRIRYSWEQPAVLGSAGGPRLALPIVDAETFVMINGDVLTDVDLAGLAETHGHTRALVTLALVPNRQYMRYGGVSVDDEGVVTGFVARGPAAAGSWHFIGAQIVEASIFKALPAGQPANSIGGVYDALLAGEPGRVRAFRSDAAYWDIGTVADYWRSSKALAASPHGQQHSIVWDNVEVGEGAILDQCIVTDNVVVPAGSEYRRAVLLRTANGGLEAVPFDPAGDR